jgi:hypothetical protein
MGIILTHDSRPDSALALFHVERYRSPRDQLSDSIRREGTIAALRHIDVPRETPSQKRETTALGVVSGSSPDCRVANGPSRQNDYIAASMLEMFHVKRKVDQDEDESEWCSGHRIRFVKLHAASGTSTVAPQKPYSSTGDEFLKLNVSVAITGYFLLSSRRHFALFSFPPANTAAMTAALQSVHAIPSMAISALLPGRVRQSTARSVAPPSSP